MYVDILGESLTSGWAFMIAMRRVLCGSSVYVQKKSCFGLVMSCLLGANADFSFLDALVTVAEPLDVIVIRLC